MLDINIQRQMVETGKTSKELGDYYDKATALVKHYVYGGAKAVVDNFHFDCMSIRAWIHALKCANVEGLTFIPTVYMTVVQSPRAEKRVMKMLGQKAYEFISEMKKKEGRIFGLRTDVAQSSSFLVDSSSKGLRRQLIKKDVVDVDARIVMFQYFSPFQDYVWHLVEIPKGTYGTVRVENSEITFSSKPDVFDDIVNKLIEELEDRSIVPHHPQYTEHSRKGLNFEIQLVQRENGKFEVADVRALINADF